ncbi:FecR domain-containing protein [Myxococcaceae bacterium GXIMD 01537]
MSRVRHGFVRSVLLGLALVALISGTGWLVHENYVEPQGRAARAPATPVPVVRPPSGGDEGMGELYVLEVAGQVERGRGGDWRPLRAGDRLVRTELIRAHEGARAALRVGSEDSLLTLMEGTEVRVEEVTRALHAFLLERGRVRVHYASRPERLLRLETGHGAVAETRGARFTVLRSGIAVAVATETGSVNLQSGGASVRVGAGEQSIAFDGEGPSAPTKIPRDVLLQVARRAAGGAGTCAPLEGRVRPGSEVRVDGVLAPVGRDGRFQVSALARPTSRVLRVEAREPAGGVREQRVPCVPVAGRPKSRPDEVRSEMKIDWDHAP